MSHFPIPSVSESSQFFTAEQEATHQTSQEAPVGLETESYSEVRSPGSRPVVVEEDNVMESWQGEGKWGATKSLLLDLDNRYSQNEWSSWVEEGALSPTLSVS